MSWAATAAADADWAKAAEGCGAVFDQDDEYDEFCAHITCNEDDEEEVEIGNVSISELSSGEFIFGVDRKSDDDLVSENYRGLRDIDGWQRKDPRGGSADAPRRAQVPSTPTIISTSTSPSTI